MAYTNNSNSMEIAWTSIGLLSTGYGCRWIVLFHSRRVHERLLYERYRSDFGWKYQLLAEYPLLLHLAPQEATLLAGLKATRQGGFVWNPWRKDRSATATKTTGLVPGRSLLREMLNRSALFANVVQTHFSRISECLAHKRLSEMQLLTASDQQSLPPNLNS